MCELESIESLHKEIKCLLADIKNEHTMNEILTFLDKDIFPITEYRNFKKCTDREKLKLVISKLKDFVIPSTRDLSDVNQNEWIKLITG